MHIQEINIELQTSNKEKSEDFFIKLLNKKPIGSNPSVIFFEIDGILFSLVAIHENEEFKTQVLKITVKDIEAMSEFLSQNKFKFSTVNKNGRIELELVDPDGNLIIFKSKINRDKLSLGSIHGVFYKADYLLKSLLKRFPYIVLILSGISIYYAVTNSFSTKSIIDDAKTDLISEVHNPILDFNNYVINTHRPLFMKYYNSSSTYTGIEIQIRNGKLKGLDRYNSDNYNNASQLRKQLTDSNYSLFELTESIKNDEVQEQINIYKEGYGENWKYFHDPIEFHKDIELAHSGLNKSFYAMDSIFKFAINYKLRNN